MKKNLTINMMYAVAVMLMFYSSVKIDINVIAIINTLTITLFYTVIIQFLPRKLRLIINGIAISGFYLFTASNIVHFQMKGTALSLSQLTYADELFTVKESVLTAITLEMILTALIPVSAIYLYVKYGENIKLKMKDATHRVLYIVTIVSIVGATVLSVAINPKLFTSVYVNRDYLEQYGLSSYLIREVLPFTKMKGNEVVKAQTTPYIQKYFSKEDSDASFRGIFSEKENVIFIVAESLDRFSIDEKLLPNLYKMSKEGITFTNYHTMTTDTTSSEFSILTSTIPPLYSSGVVNYKGEHTSIPEMFNNSGFCTMGIHSNSENYFYRAKTYPEVYKFNEAHFGEEIGVYPTSSESLYPLDYEMFKGTIPFIDDNREECEQNLTYFITFSGHTPYIPYSRRDVLDEYDQVQETYPENDSYHNTYLATQMTFDKMLGEMVDYYTEIGELDETVFIIVSDHYPYAIVDPHGNGIQTKSETLSAKYNSANELNIYNIPFIIYDPAQKLPNNDSYIGNVDILPTLGYLFDMEYSHTMGVNAYDNNVVHTVMWYGFKRSSIIGEDILYYNDTLFEGDEELIQKLLDFQTNLSINHYTQFE